MKKALFIVLIAFLFMQFFRIDKSIPKIDKQDDFISMFKPPKDVEKFLRNACYDCHSFETKYPWYAEIAPFSWWIKHHVNEGREHLNFSTFGNYDLKKRDHKLEECVEAMEEGWMPLESYTLIHKEAKLNKEQRKLLADFFNRERKMLNGIK